jgi:hypothetical protein
VLLLDLLQAQSAGVMCRLGMVRHAEILITACGGLLAAAGVIASGSLHPLATGCCHSAAVGCPSDTLCSGTPAIPTIGRGFHSSDSRSRSAIAWCLLAVAAIVTASVRRFERVYLYFGAAAVVVGLAVWQRSCWRREADAVVRRP